MIVLVSYIELPHASPRCLCPLPLLFIDLSHGTKLIRRRTTLSLAPPPASLIVSGWRSRHCCHFSSDHLLLGCAFGRLPPTALLPDLLHLPHPTSPIRVQLMKGRLLPSLERSPQARNPVWLMAEVRPDDKEALFELPPF